MGNIQTCPEAGMSVLDGLAFQARILTKSIMLNYIQLGQVLCEAKPLVKHGEWGKWLQENAPVGERSAQNIMRVYRRFGQDPNLTRLESSKLVKMLMLPEGTEQAFDADHDLDDMSVRDVEQAVSSYGKPGGTKAEDLSGSDDPPPIPVEIIDKLNATERELQRYKDMYEQYGAQSGELAKQMGEMTAERARLMTEIRQKDIALETIDQTAREAQAELLAVKSQLARGDVERAPSETLSPDAFATAVRQFIGVCQVMPHMGRALAAMDVSSRGVFEQHLAVIEGWAEGARAALGTVIVEVSGDE